jgi:hypothetical protein
MEDTDSSFISLCISEEMLSRHFDLVAQKLSWLTRSNTKVLFSPTLKASIEPFLQLMQHLKSEYLLIVPIPLWLMRHENKKAFALDKTTMIEDIRLFPWIHSIEDALEDPINYAFQRYAALKDMSRMDDDGIYIFDTAEELQNKRLSHAGDIVRMRIQEHPDKHYEAIVLE